MSTSETVGSTAELTCSGRGSATSSGSTSPTRRRGPSSPEGAATDRGRRCDACRRSDDRRGGGSQLRDRGWCLMLNYRVDGEHETVPVRQPRQDLATSEDPDPATRGDFLMATDIWAE